MRVKLTRIEKRHNRKKFDCENKDLNDFLAHSARTSDKKRMTRTYVLEDPGDPNTVMGYVTLTSTSIDIPDECYAGRKLKNPVPALLLAKMGIDKRYKGQGYGKRLLTFSIVTASEVSDKIGGIGLVIDAKDEEAKAFYVHRGGSDLEVIDESGLKLWLPIDICDYLATLQQQKSQQKPGA
ncbi:GNAT family N-acetyltransferase (plasmid) [Marinobacter nanhaiticus D15-8W]|uniref:N-acetyltransferase n=1 Tax=Marinobacter nanhaiticus D15-8W TaxID=626887 RepID=N6W3K1_9GAMM|nr:GNAT family N-acetyltransferase [Marinobacter nanhaiticus]ENO17120.1 N-acetyltransferase [Marinobacter nanhaiticus D15-8W]BES73847.1 GNAT family N-acetyltransferase [Marinobacter nanhaiticus D15-8W]